MFVPPPTPPRLTIVRRKNPLFFFLNGIFRRGKCGGEPATQAGVRKARGRKFRRTRTAFFTARPPGPYRA